jgi:hypothetical protein
VRIGGGGRERVQHAHPRRDSRSHTVPARQPRATGGTWRHVVPAVPTAQACRGLRSGGKVSRAKARAPKVSPPGAERSRLQTPRAGRRRNGGLAALPNRAALDREASLRLIAARQSGPRVRQDPGVPRRPHFRGASRWQARTRNAPRERGRLAQKEDERMRSGRRVPSPREAGRECRANARRVRGRRHVSHAPHPARTFGPRHPLPASRGEGKRVARSPLTCPWHPDRSFRILGTGSGWIDREAS